jgi:translation initiation factor IF-3
MDVGLRNALWLESPAAAAWRCRHSCPVHAGVAVEVSSLGRVCWPPGHRTGDVGIKKAAASREGRPPINDEIRAPKVRLIGADGAQVGVVTREEAMAEAKRSTLDLVMIAADADPPVCKVMDYGKHLFELKKQKAVQRKKQKQIQIKEMKFRPGTEEGDYQVKLRNLKRFLEEGDKAKVSLRYRGREMLHPEIGLDLLKRIEADLTEMAVVETSPKLEGRQLTMVLAPKAKRKK